MSASVASRQFEERGTLLPGKGQMPALRRAALARFEAQGWPNRRIESWRYTDLSPLASKSFDYVAAAPPAEVLALAADAVAGLALNPGTTRLVFVDGYWVEALSSLTSELVLEVNVLGTKPEALLASDVAGESALAALNQAFARDGAEILAASALTRPVAIVVIGSGRGLAQQLRFRLSLAAGARLTVVEHRIELANAEEAWLNSVTDIDLAGNSHLELLRLPYTGCNPRGLTLARDKSLAKKLFAYHRVPAPDFTVVPLNRKPSVRKKDLQFPLIVKSPTYESSIGISQASVVANEDQLARRVQFIHQSIGTAAIVEQYVDGRELYVGVMGNLRLQVFPVWEMSFAKMGESSWHIATERVKWSVAYQKRHGIETAAADLPPEMVSQIQHLAKRAYRALDLTGYARIDLRMRADGKLFVIEANPNPQLAQGEDFAESARHAGVEYGPLLDRIMSLGLQWRPSRMAHDIE